MLPDGKKKKTTRGRQKVEMKKIENEDALYISFSKRRNGVFAKASEISTLCGAEVLVLIYSPAGKPHTFGSPDVCMLAERFSAGGTAQPVVSLSEQAYRKGQIRGLNGQLMELGRSIEALKGRNSVILERTTGITQGLGLDEHEDGMTYEKLEELKKKLVIFKGHTEAQINFLTGAGYPPPLHADLHGIGGSSSSSSSPSSYAHIGHPMHTLDSYGQHGGGGRQNPYESAVSFNPTGAVDLLGRVPPTLFQVDWSGRRLPTESNLFESKFFRPKPSSSMNPFDVRPELDNLFK